MSCPWNMLLTTICPEHKVPIKDCPLPSPDQETLGKTIVDAQLAWRKAREAEQAP